MDRNAVLAVILISVIMTVWLVWFSPQPPVETPSEPAPAVVDESPVVPEPPVPQERETSLPDTLFEAATAGEERTIRVETDKFVALLSTHGGSIRSFQLKDYRQSDQSTPVEMVDPTARGALSLEFTSTTSHLVSTRDLYFETAAADEISVAEAPLDIAFTATLGQGALRLIYTFNPDSYQVDLTVEKVNAPSFISRSGYEMVWSGGIPFSEGTKQEANVSAALAYSGGEVEQINLVSESEERVILNGAVDWVAVRNGFFTAVVIPGFRTHGAEIEGERFSDETGQVLKEDYSARLLAPGVVAEPDAYRVYMGPIDYYEIREYGLDLYDIVDYGFGQTLTRPIAKYLIIPVFHVLSRFLESYGLIIILFAILIKLILHPLTKSSFKSMAKMRQLQPAMQEIKDKYGDDPQKQQQAMMKLYKESGVNPIGGCLPQLLQLPILYSLFRFFPSAIEIRQEGFLWCTDLSAPDVLLQLPFSLPIYGSHVSGFPLLMSAAMVLQMRLQGTQQQAGQMKVMMMIMPVFILVIFNQFAAGLSLYYLTYNVLSAIQQKFVNKNLEEEKEADATARPKKVKGGNKPLPKRVGKSKKNASGPSKRARSARQ